MFRAGIVLLTTVAVLICPYRCAARGAFESSAAQVKQGCRCCEKACSSALPKAEGPASNDELPQPHDESDDACDCICDGAVSTAQLIAEVPLVTWINRAELAARLTCVGAEQVVFLNEPCDGIESGQCPRLSMQSLLL
jgi:hypothetical protein